MYDLIDTMELVGKTIGVIRSCETREQVYTAINYVGLVKKRFKKVFPSDPWPYTIAEMYSSLAFHLSDLQLTKLRLMKGEKE